MNFNEYAIVMQQIHALSKRGWIFTIGKDVYEAHFHDGEVKFKNLEELAEWVDGFFRIGY